MPEQFVIIFFFMNAQASSFLIHTHVDCGTPCHARGLLRSSLTCDLRDTMPCQRSLTLFFPPNSSASSLTLPWTIARFLDPFYTFSPAHRRVIRDFTPPNPFYRECYGFERTFLLSGSFYFTLLIPREVQDFPRVIDILSMYLHLHT